MDPHKSVRNSIPMLDLLRAQPIAQYVPGRLARLAWKLIVHGISPLRRANPLPDPVRAGSVLINALRLMRADVVLKTINC
jgi:hypothetical protein